MSGFDYPAQTPICGADFRPTLAWEAIFTRWHSIIQTGQDAGTTAFRPTSGLWVGRQYFDTTLNKPVYVAAVKPTVWRDAAGVVV